MGKLKIAHFIFSIDKESGGTTVYMQLLADALADSCEIIVVTDIPINPAEIENVRIVPFNLSLKRLFKLKKEFRSFLTKEKPDFLHVNGIWNVPNSIIQAVAESLGIPVLITPHGMLEPWILNRNSWKKKLALRLYQKKALQNAVCIHTTADMELGNLRKFDFLKSFAFIPNGINIKQIEQKQTLPEVKQILFLSRVHVKKGIDILIEAFAQVKNKSGWEVVIAGDGEEKYIEELKGIAKKLGLEDKIKFIGPVYGSEKFDYFRRARIFALPTHCENFGYVVAEALACGTPVVTTKGAPWSVLEETNSGLWIDIGVRPLVAALDKLMALDDDELVQMGENGRRLVETRFTTKVFGEQMKSLYNWLKYKEEKPDFVI